jgi:hypothetical protein
LIRILKEPVETSPENEFIVPWSQRIVTDRTITCCKPDIFTDKRKKERFLVDFLYQPAIAGVLKKKLKKSAKTHIIYFLK